MIIQWIIHSLFIMNEYSSLWNIQWIFKKTCIIHYSLIISLLNKRQIINDYSLNNHWMFIEYSMHLSHPSVIECSLNNQWILKKTYIHPFGIINEYSNIHVLFIIQWIFKHSLIIQWTFNEYSNIHWLLHQRLAKFEKSIFMDYSMIIHVIIYWLFIKNEYSFHWNIQWIFKKACIIHYSLIIGLVNKHLINNDYSLNIQ